VDSTDADRPGKVEIVDDRQEKLLQIGGSQQIGWRDEEAAYLLPEATYAAGFGPCGPPAPRCRSRRARCGRGFAPLECCSQATRATLPARGCAVEAREVIVMSLKALGLDGSDDGPPDEPPVPPLSGKGKERTEEQAAEDGGSGREGENPGRESENPGVRLPDRGTAAGAGRGKGRKIKYLLLLLPPRPGAPTEKEGSRIDSFPPAASVQQTATDDPAVGTLMQ